MRQFILPQWFQGEEKIELEGDEFHYVCRVLRMKIGERFTGKDKNGTTYSLMLSRIGKTSCTVTAIAAYNDRFSSSPRLTLFQCIPKGPKMDQIIRQATETGVTEIVPVLSEHTIKKPDKQKTERWKRIVKEAMQQSGASRFTDIHPIIQFDEIPSVWRARGTGLFFHQIPLENNSLHSYLTCYPQQVALIIGPEGGLSGKEVTLLSKAGFLPVYLGNNVLRTETAALYAIAAVQIVLLEQQTWNKQL